MIQAPPTGDDQRAGVDREAEPSRAEPSIGGPFARATVDREVPGSHMDLRIRWMFENHTQVDPVLRPRDCER